MLEHQQILVSTSSTVPSISFLSPENSTRLGNAHFKSTLLSQSWTVCEEDDNPLIFSLTKLKVPFANWTITDASELTVGFLYLNQLFMPSGRIYCFRTTTTSGNTTWQDESGTELANTQPLGTNTELLTFNENQGGLPFGRMLIFADILIKQHSKQ